MKMGARTKLTFDVHRIIIDAVGRGLPWCHAAALADVHIDTLIEWRKKGEEAKTGIYAELSEGIKRAKAERIQSRLALIDKAADGGNWTAAAWELERSDPDNFSLKQKIEHSGTPGEPIQVEIIEHKHEDTT